MESSIIFILASFKQKLLINTPYNSIQLQTKYILSMSTSNLSQLSQLQLKINNDDCEKQQEHHQGSRRQKQQLIDEDEFYHEIQIDPELCQFDSRACQKKADLEQCKKLQVMGYGFGTEMQEKQDEKIEGQNWLKLSNQSPSIQHSLIKVKATSSPQKDLYEEIHQNLNKNSPSYLQISSHKKNDAAEHKKQYKKTVDYIQLAQFKEQYPKNNENISQQKIQQDKSSHSLNQAFNNNINFIRNNSNSKEKQSQIVKKISRSGRPHLNRNIGKQR